MHPKLRQLIALLTALCWIFAQNISLDHQFTSEHLSQNDSHICLSFANDDDDVLFSSSAASEFTELASDEFLNHHVTPLSVCQLTFRARAPPTQLS